MRRVRGADGTRSPGVYIALTLGRSTPWARRGSLRDLRVLPRGDSRGGGERTVVKAVHPGLWVPRRALNCARENARVRLVGPLAVHIALIGDDKAGKREPAGEAGRPHYGQPLSATLPHACQAFAANADDRRRGQGVSRWSTRRRCVARFLSPRPRAKPILRHRSSPAPRALRIAGDTSRSKCSATASI